MEAKATKLGSFTVSSSQEQTLIIEVSALALPSLSKPRDTLRDAGL